MIYKPRGYLGTGLILGVLLTVLTWLAFSDYLPKPNRTPNLMPTTPVAACPTLEKPKASESLAQTEKAKAVNEIIQPVMLIMLGGVAGLFVLLAPLVVWTSLRQPPNRTFSSESQEEQPEFTEEQFDTYRTSHQANNYYYHHQANQHLSNQASAANSGVEQTKNKRGNLL